MKITKRDITIREPYTTDGPGVWELVQECRPLDVNSRYCNLLQTLHFRSTSAVAVCPNEEVWGFLSGYLIPEFHNILFIWQVAVSPRARGLGLGKRMVKEILNRDAMSVRYIHTTITKDNKASWAIFRSLAKDLHAHTHTTKLFDKDVHFDGECKTEYLLQIGPIDKYRVN